MMGRKTMNELLNWNWILPKITQLKLTLKVDDVLVKLQVSFYQEFLTLSGCAFNQAVEINRKWGQKFAKKIVSWKWSKEAKSETWDNSLEILFFGACALLRKQSIRWLFELQSRDIWSGQKCKFPPALATVPNDDNAIIKAIITISLKLHILFILPVFLPVIVIYFELIINGTISNLKRHKFYILCAEVQAKIYNSLHSWSVFFSPCSGLPPRWGVQPDSIINQCPEDNTVVIENLILPNQSCL